jgi:hypothetical protein
MLILAPDSQGVRMPVTAKLSRKFYERFGDDLTTELVEWFNQVDAAYRNEFRDLFEVHFSRFDAKLEQRVAELRAEVAAKLSEVTGKLESKLAAVETRLVRWMFLFWVGTLGTVIALLKL